MESSPGSYLLLGLPRSGTTPIARTIHSYLESNTRTTYLGEYFDIQCADPSISSDGEIVYNETTRGSLPKGLDASGLRNLIDAQVAKRTSILKQSSISFFLKLFPFQLEKRQFAEIEPLCQTILLERKDVLQHCLSFGISRTLNLLYTDSGLRIPEGSVEIDCRHIKSFFLLKERFHELSSLVKKPLWLSYEQYCEQGNSALQSLFPWQVNDNNLDLSKVPSKQNPEDKLSLLKNRQEFLQEFEHARNTHG